MTNPLGHRDKQAGNIRTVLLHLIQIFTKCSDRAEQKLITVIPHEVVLWRMENSSKQLSGTKRFWVFATKSGIQKVHYLQPRKWQTQKERACSSLTLLAKVRPRRKHVFQVRCLSDNNLGLIRPKSMAPQNQGQIPVWWLNFTRWVRPQKTQEHIVNNISSSQINTCQRKYEGILVQRLKCSVSRLGFFFFFFFFWRFSHNTLFHDFLSTDFDCDFS